MPPTMDGPHFPQVQPERYGDFGHEISALPSPIIGTSIEYTGYSQDLTEKALSQSLGQPEVRT